MRTANFAARLNHRMQELGITAAELSRRMALSEAVISQYRSGKYEPKQDRLGAFAAALNVSEAWLMGYDVEPQPSRADHLSDIPGIYRPTFKKIPLLGKTACGEPIFSPNLDDGFALLDETFSAHADFALEAKGDSMSGAGIHNGDIVFFAAQEMVDPGQIAAVFVGEETMLKRVYYYPEENRIMLLSENPAHPPKTYSGPALDTIRIIGRAVAHLRKL